MRALFAAGAAFILLAGPAAAAPFTISAIGTVVATDGDLGGPTGVPLGHQIAADWTIDTVFANGSDDNAGIPSPEYEVQITFSIASYAEVRDSGGVPVPGMNVNLPTTALFYNDNETILAADLVGSVAEGLVPDGTYDIFELNGAETYGVQDPLTGEYSPYAPPGSGSALEVNLVMLGDSSWFSGAPTQLLAAQPGAYAFIMITQYDEQGGENGHLAAVITGMTETAPAAIPAPAPLLLAGSVIALAAWRARRQNRRQPA